MITVTSIYGEDGRKVGQIAKCDCKPWLSWTEFFVGILGALVALSVIMMM